MRSVLSIRAGDPGTLVVREVDEPTLRPGEVLIGVEACGVNFSDLLLVAGTYQIKPPRPFAPGAEVAGRIERIGPGVEEFQVGDRVIAIIGWGGMAERVAAMACDCVSMPDAMPYDHGATLFATYGTAHHALKQRGRAKAGETVLVLGAGGGMGLATVELARSMGARVIAAASTQEKIDLAIARGAHSGLVYPTIVADIDAAKRLAEAFKAACGAQGADIICDNVGGDIAEPALRSIGRGGRYLVIGFPGGIPRLPLNLVLLKGCAIVGVLYGSFAQHERAAYLGNVAALLALYNAGEITPHVTGRHSLEQAGEAIASLATRNAAGKLVIIPN